MKSNSTPWQPPALDPAFHNPDTSLLVIREDVELNLENARLALDGLAWIFESVASANCKLRNAEANTMLLELPPEGLAALMRLVITQIEPAVNNPPISRVLSVRPDLFHHQGV